MFFKLKIMKKTFWYQICNFKHFQKAENSDTVWPVRVKSSVLVFV